MEEKEIIREGVVEACMGCNRVKDGVCEVYLMPRRQHGRLGGCAMRTHNRTLKVQEEAFIDPLKASKQKSKGVRGSKRK